MSYTNPSLFLELALNEHEKFFDHQCKQFGNFSENMFHESFCLSLNMGRQYGHTTFILDNLRYKDDCMLILKSDQTIKHIIQRDGNLSKARKDHRIFSIGQEKRGIRLTGIKTIFIDRGMYWKSNRNIICEVLEFIHKNGILRTNDQQFRFVILG